MLIKSVLQVFGLNNTISKYYVRIFTILLHVSWAGKLSRYSDSLWAGQSGDRIPMGEEIFPPVQTGPWAYPASCTMGLSRGVKRWGVVLTIHPPSKCRGHERVGLHLYPHSGPSWPVIGRTLLHVSAKLFGHHKFIKRECNLGRSISCYKQ